MARLYIGDSDSLTFLKDVSGQTLSPHRYLVESSMWADEVAPERPSTNDFRFAHTSDPDCGPYRFMRYVQLMVLVYV
jgi:hypothetical protein